MLAWCRRASCEHSSSKSSRYLCRWQQISLNKGCPRWARIILPNLHTQSYSEELEGLASCRDRGGWDFGVFYLVDWRCWRCSVGQVPALFLEGKSTLSSTTTSKFDIMLVKILLLRSWRLFPYQHEALLSVLQFLLQVLGENCWSPLGVFAWDRGPSKHWPPPHSTTTYWGYLQVI